MKGLKDAALESQQKDFLRQWHSSFYDFIWQLRTTFVSLLYLMDTWKYLGLCLHCVASKPNSLDLTILPNTIHYFMLESVISNSFFFPHLTTNSSFESQHFISSHYALLTYNRNACFYLLKQKDIIDFACFVVLPFYSPIFIL